MKTKTKNMGNDNTKQKVDLCLSNNLWIYNTKYNTWTYDTKTHICKHIFVQYCHSN